MKKSLYLLVLFLVPFMSGYAKEVINPILPYDYSDPDVIRVGKDYYMTYSTFACTPGLQILR